MDGMYMRESEGIEKGGRDMKKYKKKKKKKKKAHDRFNGSNTIGCR